MTERSSPEGELVRDTPAEEREASRYLRLPMPVVALGLLIVLAVLFAVGLYANRNLRPQGASVPPTPAAAAAAVAPTSTPLPLAAAQPTSTAAAAPTAAPTITRQPTATPQPTAVATLAPTAAPTALVVGTAATPPANAPPTPLPTVEPTLAAEVGQAYETYWQVRAQALLDLDKSRLSEAMGGDHLASTAQLIDELHEENRAIQTRVDHDYRVVLASGDSAQVFDDYISNSFYVDPSTRMALTAPATDELKVLYQLKELDGTWKVVDSVRAQ